jgi:hypothetical protein
VHPIGFSYKPRELDGKRCRARVRCGGQIVALESAVRATAAAQRRKQIWRTKAALEGAGMASGGGAAPGIADVVRSVCPHTHRELLDEALHLSEKCKVLPLKRRAAVAGGGAGREGLDGLKPDLAAGILVTLTPEVRNQCA